MIARLAGLVDAIERDRVVIDLNGVGYLVRASSRTLATLQPGARTTLLVETSVREDAIDLYGFATAAERDWFRLLTTVQGVGAKVALSLLSALAPAELARAIAFGDRAMLTRAEGVGPKLANRLASELKDKVGALGTVAAPALPGAVATAKGGADGAIEDAVSALVNLGYRRPEAIGAIEKAVARLGPDARVEALIPESLKELAR
ncbi:MAG: Holliday junction branch migration protein RuvA [Alphaproteobacteria bacterium]|nr:Holliday junction branch migration protein RuvA [Alphaproteobacteria bacterium]